MSFGTKAVNVGGLPQSIKTFGAFNVLNVPRADGSTYGLSIFFVILVVILIITYLILKFTMVGRGIYAIGGNLEAAQELALVPAKFSFLSTCMQGFSRNNGSNAFSFNQV